MRDTTPIAVGCGQFVGRDPQRVEDMLSPVALAARAAERACADAGAARPLAAAIDLIAVVRLFEHSVADSAMWPNPFGSCANVPWAVARRLGARPRAAIYAEVGGQSPQRLINQLAPRIAAGEIKVALITGAEAIATIRDATRRGIALDWREEAQGDFEDRWPGKPFVTPYERRHGVVWPIQVYALCEQVRRHARRQSLAAYRADIARMLASFSAVAERHPYAMFPRAHGSEFLATPSAENYLLCEPYTKWMVAQDAVNQAAAVVLTSVGQARELGIAESRWVYLHGAADVDDRYLLERPDLAQSRAQSAAVTQALAQAECELGAINHRDFYSCFPIAVSSIAEPLGLPLDGSVQLTLTGGLPYFGGPGNNYSLHAIATLVDTLRRERAARGMVVANGGYLSKHSVGIYAGMPPAGGWQPPAPTMTLDHVARHVDESATGAAQIESYAAIHSRAGPADGFVVARMLADDARVMARVRADDRAALEALFAEQVIGRHIAISRDGDLHRFQLSSAA